MAIVTSKNNHEDLFRDRRGAIDEKDCSLDLKDIWGSLYKANNFNSLTEKDPDILGVLMLLQTAVQSVKQVGSRYESLLGSFKSSRIELEETKVECTQLKENLKSLKNSACGKCPALKSQLKEANRKAEEAQTRMNSIARILSLGEEKHSQTGDKCGSTANLVTQILMCTSESPKRKKRSKIDQDIKRDKGEDLAPESVEPYTCAVANRVGEVVPETMYEDATQKLSPYKAPSPQPAAKTSKAPEVSMWMDGQKKLSNSVNIPPSRVKEVLPAKKNLSADLGKTGKENIEDSSPVKRIDFKLELPKNEGPSGEAILDDSLKDWVKTNNSELDKIWFNEGDKEDKNTSWKLKERRGTDGREGGKRMKQMTLGVEIKSKKKDLSQMAAFRAAGARANPPENTSEEEMDIVFPSPRKAKGLKKKKPAKNDTIDLALFAPLATSTQVPRVNLENSFDRPPPKKKDSPNYKYKREAVRKREDRAKLEGRKCEECDEYFKTAGKDLAPGELQERLNYCSRHRDPYVRVKSPPGFWDPVMPDTQECRERGMYTSVYRIREDN